MRSRLPLSIARSLLTVVALASLGALVAGQRTPSPTGGVTKTTALRNWTPPRTPWGDPDLQGQWNSQTSTPLERPLSGPLAGKDTLPDGEAETLEEKHLDQFDQAPRAGDPGTYNAFWRDPGKALARTSLIIDPPDGRVPALTPEAQRRADAERAERSKHGPADSYEDMSTWTRCISRGWNGIGSDYSSNYQIFQSPGYVVVYQELIHEPRIIPLDGRSHLPQNVKQWMGDSRGHWDGNTLVVETTNFDPRTNFRGSRDTLHLIERYTRIAPDTIDYQFAVDDPKTFTRPFTVSKPMNRETGGTLVFEYACHEGNYAMTNMLKGARVQENAAKLKKPQP
jgi:hypothetical protein